MGTRITNGATGGHGMCPPPAPGEKSRDWQLELLMEKLRSKAAQFKTFPEMSKNVRMSLLEKRYNLDSVEKGQHQKCLDTLQHSIKVTSLQSMVERLESLTRQLGLKFVQAPSGVELFISSDMFYLEIVLDQSGSVRDVKVHHEGKVEQQSCEELVSCLSRGDFADFTAQLEGLASIYQLNAEKKVKCKAFTALQSLEADLSTLAQLQTFIKEPFNVLHKSPVGILEKRKGGHAMKLTYFVSPYDLIDKEKATVEPISVESIVGKNLGYSVTVYMEGSTAHKLQTSTIITVNRNLNGKGTPSYAPVTTQNSAMIPACFVLKLNKPMPMCAELVRQIQQITEIEFGDLTTSKPLLGLISTHSSDGKLESGGNRGLFVTLPDQTHCYFMTENKNMHGIVVTSIPFTHPGHVPAILVILRQQALFNTMIASCIRPKSKQDFENMVMLEVNALTWTHISISLEHPIEESMATAEIDLSDISNLNCKVHSPGSPPPANAPDVASDITSKALNRCFSIPVTMRAVLTHWDRQIVRKTHYNGHENFNLPLGPGDPGGRSSGTDYDATQGGAGAPGAKIKQEPQVPGAGHAMMPLIHPHQGMFLNESLMSSANFTNFQTAEASAVLTNIELTNILSGNDKPKRKRKGDELWKSGKRKADDEMLLDASSCDSTSRSTPLSQETVSEIQTPNSALGFHSDLELSALDPSELIGEKDGGEFDADDLGDVEEILSGKSCKLNKTPPLLGDYSDKTLVPPSVSITPIPTTQGFGSSAQNIERRMGIEIIPISTATTLPSSITITPITTSTKTEERSKEKKSNKIRTDDKGKLEKKKKRKREESPMGPPEKIPTKQDPLTKPVSVSIKPTESPPTLNMTPTSPSMIRKFSQSPTHNRSVPISGKLSPSMLKPGGLKPHSSPKHSPAHVPASSPKHGTSATSSPKSHSPKHPSSGGSGSGGKPSMSTLKNAASSPSAKSAEGKSKSSKDSSRDKDKKSSSAFPLNSTKSKTSGKVKALDLNAMVEAVPPDRLPSPVGMDLSKPSNSNQARNRKACLSAIVDKLKNAQHSDIPTDLTSKSKERSPQISSKLSEPSNKTSSKQGDAKNSEYMVKHSLDGMKITINKTRSKDSSSKSSLKSSGTGLKPGVNSGPASKKPQQQIPKLTSNSTSYPSAGNAGTGGLPSSLFKGTKPISKSTSLAQNLLSKSSSSKLSASPKSSSSSSATDLSRGNRDRPKLNRSSSDKSIFSNRSDKKGSPTQNRDETDGYKALPKLDHFPSALMDGMKFDKNFQIPKLSARTPDDKKPQIKLNNDTAVNNFVMNKTELPKYPLAIPSGKMFDGSMEAKIRNTMNMAATAPNNLPGSSPKTKDDDDDKKPVLPYYPISTAGKSFPPPSSDQPLSLAARSVDLTSKFIPPAPKDDAKLKDKKGEDGLIDYSSKAEKLGGFPPSPSVSVHIVKSPAPSPLVNPSPHSASPGITDDELMDEALVGSGK